MNEQAIRESFSLAKQDIQSNSNRISELKREIIQLKNHVYVLEEKAGTKKITEEPNNELKTALRDVLKEMDSRRQTYDVFDKKNTIKKKIVEFLNNNNVDIPRLKQIFVDENRYCSKASFYRYIDELKKENKIENEKMVMA